MTVKKITAVIRTSALENVENKLRELRVGGLTVFPIKGYGEAANLLSPDWMTRGYQLEIYAEEVRTQEIVAAILEAASAGLPGDGVVEISSVDTLYRIRDKSVID